MSTSLDVGAAIPKFRESFRGSLLVESDSGYEEARKVHNGLIDKRPTLIARCNGAEEVVRALEFAERHGLEVAVRGGGHNVGGRGVTDGGLMIDLSARRSVQVDPEKRIAIAEGGATWADFNEATQRHGLATTGGVVSSTGIAGLTLGGGFGWLMGRHGLAADNLIGAQLVTAQGKILTVNADDHPDLFWAIRGGGGNFGVATTLTYRIHPVGEVIGGIAAHPLDRGPEMLRFYRNATAQASDDLGLFAGLLHAPDGSGAKLSAMVAFHPDAKRGMAELESVRAFGPPIMDSIGPTTYCQVNTMLDGGFPRGSFNYWKSSFLSSLNDDAIETMVAAFRQCPAPLGAMILEHFHGAVTRVGVSDTAFPHRQPGYNLLVASQWLDASQSAECIGWARGTYEVMRPFMAVARYGNYLGDDESEDQAAAAYGPNYPRLREIKGKYDPMNVFHLNQNIRPA